MSISLRPALFACAFVSAAGCGGGNAATPEAALQKLLDAAKDGNAGAFRGGFPSHEEIAELFECPPGVDLATRYDGLSDEFVAWRDAHPVLAAGGLEVGVHTVIEAGDEIGGCKARREMSMMRADVRLTEGANQRLYAMRFVELDGRFRVLGF